MEATTALISLIVSLLVILVTVVVWLIRLEGKVKTHDRDIAEVKGDLKGELKDIRDIVTDIRVIIAGMQGYKQGCSEATDGR